VKAIESNVKNLSKMLYHTNIQKNSKNKTILIKKYHSFDYKNKNITY